MRNNVLHKCFWMYNLQERPFITCHFNNEHNSFSVNMLLQLLTYLYIRKVFSLKKHKQMHPLGQGTELLPILDIQGDFYDKGMLPCPHNVS